MKVQTLFFLSYKGHLTSLFPFYNHILFQEEPPPTPTPTPSHPIYTPLADLKFHYQSTSRPSSVQGSASTALPLIPTQRSKYRALSSQSQEYKKTINETLRMKLKLGHIHDQISAIDQKMAKESKKYRNAVEKHENFQKSFEQFLSKQYDRVKQKLLELEAQETESDQLKEKLADLQRTITVKSLHIYELEHAWRHHKKSQLFLSHLGNLLKNDEDSVASPVVGSAATSVVVTSPTAVSTADTLAGAPSPVDSPAAALILADSSAIGSSASSGADSPAAAAFADSLTAASFSVTDSSAASAEGVAASIPETPPEMSIPDVDSLPIQPNFNVDPTCDTPTLDDLISNYELHDQQEEPFVEEHYAHVTPAKVEDFLDKLKRQNIRLLRHKLEHEKVKNILEEAEKVCDIDAHNQATALAQQVAEVQRKLEAQTSEVSQAEQHLQEVMQKGCGFAETDVETLKKFVEKLYGQIFKPTYEEHSHVHMAKCVEEYVQSLLCQLYSYEPQILKKALRRN